MPKPPGITVSCSGCKFYDPQFPVGTDATIGTCFRYPAKPSTDQNMRAVWPVVDANAWCGEWVTL